MGVVVHCEWAEGLLLSAEKGRQSRTSWCFLDELESNGVPPQVAAFARETSAEVRQIRISAEGILQNGVLGTYQQMIDACVGLEAQRAKIMDRFQSSEPRHCRLREAQIKAKHVLQSGQHSTWELAQRVATGLLCDHYAVVDGFLSDGAGAIGTLVRAMHQAGELQPGEVMSGLRASQRGDLMTWVPAGAEQPSALRTLLSALDRLLLALVHQPKVMADLGSVPLIRAETQCTCYPGNGARYVKHTDDARRQDRKLTCILYANPGYSAASGGELCLHRPGHEPLNIEPLDNRLVRGRPFLLFPENSRPTHDRLVWRYRPAWKCQRCAC